MNMQLASESASRPAPEPLLHPIPHAARILGIGRSSVYELIEDGRLTSVKIGRRRLIPDVAIRKFLTSIGASS